MPLLHDKSRPLDLGRVVSELYVYVSLHVLRRPILCPDNKHCLHRLRTFPYISSWEQKGPKPRAPT